MTCRKQRDRGSREAPQFPPPPKRARGGVSVKLPAEPGRRETTVLGLEIRRLLRNAADRDLRGSSYRPFLSAVRLNKAYANHSLATTSRPSSCQQGAFTAPSWLPPRAGRWSARSGRAAGARPSIRLTPLVAGRYIVIKI